MSLMQDLTDYLTGVSFRNNENLRPAGTQIAYTEEMITELIRCKSDPIYFIENYIHVVHPDRGVVKMQLYPYQTKMINGYHNNSRCVVVTPRQYGKTVSAAAYLTWYVMFNDNKTAAILGNKQSTSDEIMHRVRMMLENLPKWIQQGIRTWNKRSVELENGSRIFGAATSSSGIRGKSIQCVASGTEITVRNKLTGNIEKISIGEFANRINNTNANSPRNIENDNDTAEIHFY